MKPSISYNHIAPQFSVKNVEDSINFYSQILGFGVDYLSGSQPNYAVVFRDEVYISSKKKIITPKTINQKNYIDKIRKFDIVFGIGPAGTGKTYLAMAMAISSLMKKLVHRGYVEKSSTEPYAERGGRSKYLYALTPNGEEALRIIRKIYKSIWTEDCEIAFD